MKEIKLQNVEPDTPVMAEEFRKIHTSLEFSLTDKHVVCFTSSFPNEGKSYVSFHVAKTIAESGYKTILVDADMRNSTFYQKLGYEKEMDGLSHVLTGKKGVNECIYATDIDRLYLLPTGVFSSNSTRLFRTKQFPALLNALSKVFDYVIIDTPPIGLVTDAEIIANACSGTVLIVGSNMEHRGEVRESIEKLNNATENFLGVILNKADAQGGGYGYGKYGRYGKYGYGKYGYGYGYGYGNTDTDGKEEK